jgi:hypothetical protein
MRVLFALLVVVIPAAAQNPLVRLVNASHPASSVFQVGDRFEVLVTGAPNQPVSVRTTMNGRTGWGPIIGSTDSTGRWSTAGQFEKNDFGGWYEVWTVGGKLASPVVQFSVNAPCLPGGRGMAFTSGPNVMQTCETAEGSQSFSTSPGSNSFSNFRWQPGPSELNRTRSSGCVPDGNPSALDYRSGTINGSRPALVLKRRPGR